MFSPALIRASGMLIGVVAIAVPLRAQMASAVYRPPAEDVEAVRQAVLDYVEGLYLVAPSRIERSVSRGLAKIGIGSGSHPTREMTENRMTYRQLYELAGDWNADGEVPPDAIKEIVVFEVLNYTASVKLVASWGIDYMHLAKYDDRWLIVNVIYQGHPGEN